MKIFLEKVFLFGYQKHVCHFISAATFIETILIRKKTRFDERNRQCQGFVCRWFFPFIGHMGICTSAGIIRDFAGPYYVGQNQMAFGKPTRYLKLHASYAQGLPLL
jgi:hypothetical protein